MAVFIYRGDRADGGVIDHASQKRMHHPVGMGREG
jgi:hypothetical protein